MSLKLKEMLQMDWSHQMSSMMDAERRRQNALTTQGMSNSQPMLAYPTLFNHPYLRRWSAGNESPTSSDSSFSTQLQSPHTPASPPLSIDSSDEPVDLSMPKTTNNIRKTPKKSSNLEGLLTGAKRSLHNDTLPLNLSKRKRLNSNDLISQSGLSEPKLQSLLSNREINYSAITYRMEDAQDDSSRNVSLHDCKSVHSNITKILFQMLERVRSLRFLQEFSDEKVLELVSGSWHRLLLWIFASTDFSFRFVCSSSSSYSGPKVRENGSLPTMAFVKGLDRFIQRYKEMSIDDTEMRLLFSLTLLHCGQHSWYRSTSVETHKSKLMNELQRYVTDRKSADRYAQLLLLLPMLYGINETMFETLFLTNFHPHHDARALVKDIFNIAR